MQKDYSAYSDDALIEAAASVAEDMDGRQWAQGEIALEVRRRSTYGTFDMKRYSAAARRAEKTLYAYAQTVDLYMAAGFSSWGDFSRRFGCGFTVARDVALKFDDPTAAVSYLEERAELPDEQRWRVESVRASLKGLFAPDAPRRVAMLDSVPLSVDVVTDSAQSIVGAVVEIAITPEQYHALQDVDRAGCFRVVVYELRGKRAA